MIAYIPKQRSIPPNLLNVPTAWAEVTPVIRDILQRFEVRRRCVIEFGVDYGYSLSVFAKFFDLAVGIDTFMGDINAGDRGKGIYDQVAASLMPYGNVAIVKSDYRDWIKDNDQRYDLSHVDIVHNYEQTFECGEWAVQHSNVALFHDTLAFPEVMSAVTDLATKHGLNFFNVNEQHGLGILTKRVPHD